MANELNPVEPARILVTGASGFLGQALCRRLRVEGFLVTALSRGAPTVFGVSWVQVRSYEGAGAFLSMHDCVVHLAARVHIMKDAAVDPLTTFRAANVDVSLNLARQAAAAGVKRFVFMSSVKVNGESTQVGHPYTEVNVPNPQDAYGISKHEAEQGLREIAAQTGMEVVIIRSPLVYGPGVKANFAALMRAVQKGWPLPLGAVHNQRSLVALDNLVDFVITCAIHPQAANQTFMVSDGHDVSISELVRGLANAMQVTSRLLPIPVWLLGAGAALMGKRASAQRLCGNLQVDMSKARHLLGWKPPIAVDEGLRRVVTGMAGP